MSTSAIRDYCNSLGFRAQRPGGLPPENAPGRQNMFPVLMKEEEHFYQKGPDENERKSVAGIITQSIGNVVILTDFVPPA